MLEAGKLQAFSFRLLSTGDILSIPPKVGPNAGREESGLFRLSRVSKPVTR